MIELLVDLRSFPHWSLPGHESPKESLRSVEVDDQVSGGYFLGREITESSRTTFHSGEKLLTGFIKKSWIRISKWNTDSKIQQKIVKFEWFCESIQTIKLKLLRKEDIAKKMKISATKLMIHLRNGTTKLKTHCLFNFKSFITTNRSIKFAPLLDTLHKIYRS